MDALNTDYWWGRLEPILASSEGRDADELITEICDLGAEIGNDAGEALLEAHPELFEYKPTLIKVFEQMVIEKDAVMAKLWLDREFDGPVSYLDVADDYAKSVYKRPSATFDHVNFRECARAVMIGCGPNPFTIVHIHDMTEVPEIIGLDIVPEAVATTNALADKLGYDRMRAELCDGCDYDFSEAQVIYVASMLARKAAVLSRIIATAPDNVQIVVREPCSIGRLWSESVVHSIDERMEIFNYGPVSRTLTRDVFMRRQGQSISRRLSG